MECSDFLCKIQETTNCGNPCTRTEILPRGLHLRARRRAGAETRRRERSRDPCVCFRLKDLIWLMPISHDCIEITAKQFLLFQKIYASPASKCITVLMHYGTFSLRSQARESVCVCCNFQNVNIFFRVVGSNFQIIETIY